MNTPCPLKQSLCRLTLHADGVMELELEWFFRNDENHVIEIAHHFPIAPGFAPGRVFVDGKPAEPTESGDPVADGERALESGEGVLLLRYGRFHGGELLTGPLMPGAVRRIAWCFHAVVEPEEGKVVLHIPQPLPMLFTSRLRQTGTPPSPVYADSVEYITSFELISKLAAAHDFRLNGQKAHLQRDSEGYRLRQVIAPDCDLELSFRPEREDGNLLLADADRLYLSVEVPEEFAPPPMRHEIILLIDASRSMFRNSVDYAGSTACEVLRHLTAEDCFNILFFSTGSHALYAQSQHATLERLGEASAWLRHPPVSCAGTEFADALECVRKLPAKEGRIRSVVLISDGGFFQPDHVRLFRREMRIFPIGTGSWVHCRGLDELARASGTWCEIIGEDHEMEEKVFRQMNRLYSAFQAELTLNGQRVRSVAPCCCPGTLFALNLDRRQYDDRNGKIELVCEGQVWARGTLRETKHLPVLPLQDAARLFLLPELTPSMTVPVLREVPAVCKRNQAPVSGPSRFWTHLQSGQVAYAQVDGAATRSKAQSDSNKEE